MVQGTFFNDIVFILFFLFSAIWHQYDDAIFSEPNLFQKLLNKLPVWKSMDVVEGRNLATLAMLPPWRGVLDKGGDTAMAAWETVQIIGDLAYCMTKSTVEEYGSNVSNVPARYSFSKVSCYSWCVQL